MHRTSRRTRRAFTPALREQNLVLGSAGVRWPCRRSVREVGIHPTRRIPSRALSLSGATEAAGYCGVSISPAHLLGLAKRQTSFRCGRVCLSHVRRFI
jgi:hypothetical protein